VHPHMNPHYQEGGYERISTGSSRVSILTEPCGRGKQG
jgi:hypothetical protein